MLFEIPVERMEAALRSELGDPTTASGREIRWPGETSKRRFVLYRASGKFLDCADGRGTSVWNFLRRRGWDKRRLRDALLDGLDRLPERAPRPAPPEFRPAADNRSLQGWRRRWVDRAWDAPPAGESPVARAWHSDPARGDKPGAWPAGWPLPETVRWVPAGARDRARGNEQLAGWLAVPLHPLRAWRAMWRDGARRPARETCLAVHLIALRADGSKHSVRGWRSGDWTKLTIGEKRGCLWACGARAGRREAEGGVPRTFVVEGLADGLTAASRWWRDSLVLSSVGVDIASATHARTHRWLAHCSRETWVVLDPDETGQARAAEMAASIRAKGGRARTWADPRGRDPYDAWGAPRARLRGRGGGPGR